MNILGSAAIAGRPAVRAALAYEKRLAEESLAKENLAAALGVDRATISDLVEKYPDLLNMPLALFYNHPREET